MTHGQSLALEQVRRVADSGGAMEILRVVPPDDDVASLRLVLSLYCGDMPREPTGLRLRDRERVIVSVGEHFPYDYPHVTVSHSRFAGFPHVNWSRCLCMYQAPQTEWSPGAGMFGFLSRLELWFRKAAIDQLDAPGGALHPPVTYVTTGPMMIPRRDAPVRDAELWTGLVELQEVSAKRVDLVDWIRIGDRSPAGLAGAAILLDRTMPLEFPSKLGDLIRCLEERTVPLTKIFETLQIALAHNGKQKPLYVIVGTPMRGIRGGELRQHLTAWRVEPFAVDVLEMDASIEETENIARSLGARELTNVVTDLRERVVGLFRRWADATDVTWCRIREDRPEVTMRRDTGRPAAAFAGRTVEVWGCGALGGYIAEWVVRAGASQVILRDESVVSPGILVRQPFVDSDIGRPKAEALGDRLRGIRSTCEVVVKIGDVLHNPLATDILSDTADLIIDATASNLVLTKLEEVWRTNPKAQRPVASITIDRSAERLLAVLVRPGHSGGPLDTVRKMKLMACRDERLSAYLDAFFPDPLPPPFQPEPGCSDATFVGSAADAALLSAEAVNYIGKALQCDAETTADGCFLTSAGVLASSSSRVQVSLGGDMVFADPGSGYDVRVDKTAWREMEAWMSESQRRRGPEVETGGLLFGEVDEHLGIVWVSEASGPPPDSQHSAGAFICGTEGTQEINNAKMKRSQKSVCYIGTWHSHPTSSAIPSVRDFVAMDALIRHNPTRVDRLTLLIIGKPEGRSEATASVFLRQQFERLRTEGQVIRTIQTHSTSSNRSVARRRIGLALSGGGSRAIAFHLGCLRALHDRGLLSQLEVISTVSGGSVIGAMFAYSNDAFEDFDTRVQALLRKGLVEAIARRTVLSHRLLQIMGTKLVSGSAANLSFIARFLMGRIESILPRRSRARGLMSQRIQPPLRRWASRTHAFEQTLRDLLFGETLLKSERRDGVDVVINACELRTGTAFRFGSRESGCWRYGTISGNEAEVATAVAASAAYPALLPAIDRHFAFDLTNGDRRRERVILTDGGVYENLGVTCMVPERDTSVSTNVFHPEYVFCCDAGPGQFSDVVLPYGWTTRMQRSFEATHRQVQHGLQKQLHMWRQEGVLSGFIYSYLGQQDERLPFVPSKLVRRSEVIHYPTDFSAMTEIDINLLSCRGEQLTRLLIDYYCPEL